jgi:hypothetical protein
MPGGAVSRTVIDLDDDPVAGPALARLRAEAPAGDGAFDPELFENLDPELFENKADYRR